MSTEETVQPPPPPGFELFFSITSPLTVTPFNYLVLPIHWSIIRTPKHNYRLLSGPNLFTEALPGDWEAQVEGSQVDDGGDKGRPSLQLFYKNVNPNGRILRVKLALIEDDGVAVEFRAATGDGIVVEEDDGGGEKSSSSVNVLKIQDFLRLEAVGKLEQASGGGANPLFSVYKVGELWKLEETVQKWLVASGVEEKSPYASKLEKPEKTKTDTKKPDDPTPAPKHPANSPLFVPTPYYDPIRDLGRSDLDPFGIIPSSGGGGMVMDPRGLRGRNPPGILPGARFDPIGPPGRGGFGPGRGGFGPFGGVGPRAPRLPFGMPDPDHEMFPGGSSYDDMFS